MGNNFLLFTINQSQMKLNLILLILELTSMDPTIKLQVKYRVVSPLDDQYDVFVD